MRKGHLTVLLTSISFAKYSCRNSVSIVKSNQLRFTSSLKSKTFMDVYIALGSNIGDRSFAICQAIQELRAIGDVKSTSFLYETVPMYHSDQGNFFNAACLLQTKLQPLELLIEIQRIEKDVGRTTTFQNGPRIIDLDILMYSDMRIDTEQLQVPHPRIAERCFVLRPLCDIAGTAQLTDPCGRVYSISELYHKLPQASKDEVRRVSPVYNHLRKQTQFLKDSPKQQQIMGILNVTPDRCSTVSISISLN